MCSAKNIPHSPSDELFSPAERVTRQIKAALERGVRPWVKPWDSAKSAPLALPLRANGVAYRGVNTLALWAAADERGFASPFWFTFKQCQAVKAAVRKGERGSFVVYYKPGADKALSPSASDAPETSSTDRRRILRGYVVFNAEQVEGLPGRYFPEETPPPAPPDAEDMRMSALFAKIPAAVRYGGDRAFYAPGLDYVQMPAKAAFGDPTQFWATLAHEQTHWTRSPARLNRDFGQKRFGDPGYALEELTAEIGAAFLGAQIGLPADHIEDHAAYIGSWLRTLTTTPTAFLTAAAKAQTAADCLLDLMGVRAAATPIANDACVGEA